MKYLGRTFTNTRKKTGSVDRISKAKKIILVTVLCLFVVYAIIPSLSFIPQSVRSKISLTDVSASGSLVQQTSNSCSAATCPTTFTVTTGIAITGGNVLVVVYGQEPSGGASAISDTAGNTWTAIWGPSTGTCGFGASVPCYAIWDAPITLGSGSTDQVKITQTTTKANSFVWVGEITGVKTGSEVLYTSGTSGTGQAIGGAGASFSGGSITPPANGFVTSVLYYVYSSGTCTGVTAVAQGSYTLASAGMQPNTTITTNGGMTVSYVPNPTGAAIGLPDIKLTSPNACAINYGGLSFGLQPVTQATQPIKATATTGTTQQTVTLSGCGPSPSTYAGDGATHNIVVTVSCSITNTLPAGYLWLTTGTRTWSFTTCASGTCSLQSNTYTSHPYVSQTKSCWFNTSSSGVCTFAKTVPVGDSVVVGLVNSISTTQATSVTDNASTPNTYEQIVTKNTQGLAGDAEIWFAPVTHSTRIKVNATFGLSLSGGIILYDINITSASYPDDFSTGSSANASTATVTSFSPDSNSLVIGVLDSTCRVGCTVTAGTNFVLDNNHVIGSATFQGSSESNVTVIPTTVPFGLSVANAYNEVAVGVLFPSQTVSITVALKLSIKGLPTHSIPFYTINQTQPKERNNYTLWCDNAGVNTSTQLVTASTTVTCDQGVVVKITAKATLSNESIEWVFNNASSIISFESNPNSTAQSPTYYYYCLVNITSKVNDTQTLAYSTAPLSSGSTDNPVLSHISLVPNTFGTAWIRLGSVINQTAFKTTTTSTTSTTLSTTTTTTFSNTTTTTFTKTVNSTTTTTTSTTTSTTSTTTTSTTTTNTTSTTTTSISTSNLYGHVQGYPDVAAVLVIIIVAAGGFSLVVLRRRSSVS